MDKYREERALSGTVEEIDRDADAAGSLCAGKFAFAFFSRLLSRSAYFEFTIDCDCGVSKVMSYCQCGVGGCLILFKLRSYCTVSPEVMNQYYGDRQCMRFL